MFLSSDDFEKNSESGGTEELASVLNGMNGEHKMIEYLNKDSNKELKTLVLEHADTFKMYVEFLQKEGTDMNIEKGNIDDIFKVFNMIVKIKSDDVGILLREKLEEYKEKNEDIDVKVKDFLAFLSTSLLVVKSSSTKTGDEPPSLFDDEEEEGLDNEDTNGWDEDWSEEEDDKDGEGDDDEVEEEDDDDDLLDWIRRDAEASSSDSSEPIVRDVQDISLEDLEKDELLGEIGKKGVMFSYVSVDSDFRGKAGSAQLISNDKENKLSSVVNHGKISNDIQYSLVGSIGVSTKLPTEFNVDAGVALQPYSGNDITFNGEPAYCINFAYVGMSYNKRLRDPKTKRTLEHVLMSVVLPKSIAEEAFKKIQNNPKYIEAILRKVDPELIDHITKPGRIENADSRSILEEGDKVMIRDNSVDDDTNISDDEIDDDEIFDEEPLDNESGLIGKVKKAWSRILGGKGK